MTLRFDLRKANVLRLAAHHGPIPVFPSGRNYRLIEIQWLVGPLVDRAD